jgi:hypothetical protein
MSDAADTAGVHGGDDNDNALLAELRALAAEHDPVPPGAIAAARSAIAWRTMDAELAELIGDAASDAPLAGVRSAATPTLLTFESPNLTVEVEVLETATGLRLLGQLVPGTPGQVEARHQGGTTTVAADEIGRFRVDGVPSGPVSLRCSAGPRVVETDWFLA